MPIEVTYAQDASWIEMRITNPFDMDDARHGADRIAALIASDAPRRLLSDHTRLETPLTPAQLEEVVQHFLALRAELAHLRWAIVTEMDLSFGMMRMLSAWVAPVPMHVTVFRDRAAAVSWLLETS